MALVIAPASALDLLEAVDDAGGGAAVRGRARFGRLARQVAGGLALTVRTEGGALVLVAGLHPEGDELEAWLAAGPAVRAHAGEAVRRVRRLFCAWCEALAGDGQGAVVVRAYVHPESVAGARLAALFGGQRDEVRMTPLGPLETWARSFAA